METTAIVWLRRDLRITDHFAFYKAQEVGAKILPVFVFDSEILNNFQNKEDKRISFIYDRLVFLNKQLQKYKVEIKVFYGSAVEVLESLILSLSPTYLIAGEGYESYDLKRDQKIKTICADKGVISFFKNDHLIYPPNAIKKDDGDPFKVFTPYSRKLYKKLVSDIVPNYQVEVLEQWNVSLSESLKSQLLDLNIYQNSFNQIGYQKVAYDPWRCDFQTQDMSSFLLKIGQYKENRDFLYVDGTSKFSPYLRFGFISIRDCLRLALSSQHSFSWINELMWRDFYAMALYFYPNIGNEEMIAKYRGLKWNRNQELFEKFAEGMTGFPIVDAAMRQLNKIGWVHNRARMIVASFLTKYMLMDWRLGEKLYAQKLMDYEMSSNVGGWQWAASTGFDSQPYFRIFNLELQSKKFDQYGEYIKEYIAEISHVPGKSIVNPLQYDSSLNYPQPIVGYQGVRNRAIAFFKNATI
ncbi:MAG: deoxyribodipyrimidine photo-lyase [Rickettsiales bacterium]|nr:deoxyribodipyrimidine photo-lyase [Rickettsiales bacterium]